MGVSESIGSDVPNLMKDVPNLINDVLNFVKDVPRVRKCVPKWGSTANHFFMGLYKILWSIHIEMGVRESVEYDVPNLVHPSLVISGPPFDNG